MAKVTNGAGSAALLGKIGLDERRGELRTAGRPESCDALARFELRKGLLPAERERALLFPKVERVESVESTIMQATQEPCPCLLPWRSGKRSRAGDLENHPAPLFVVNRDARCGHAMVFQAGEGAPEFAVFTEEDEVSPLNRELPAVCFAASWGTRYEGVEERRVLA